MGTGWLELMGAGSREVAEPAAGGCQGCLCGVLENETPAPGLDEPMEPVRHPWGLAQHQPSRGSRNIPKSPPASFQLAKRYHLAGAFPKPTDFWSQFLETGARRTQPNTFVPGWKVPGGPGEGLGQ